MNSYPLSCLLGCALLAWSGISPARAEEPARATATPTPSGTGALALLRQLDEGFVQIFDRVAPAVVVIETANKSRWQGEAVPFDPFAPLPGDDSNQPFRMPERHPQTRSEGSGFILRADGMIATNRHVIEGAEKITVRLKDGRRFPAKVIGKDDFTDVAVIKIEAADLPVAELANSDKVRVGQIVCAIGVPYSLDYSFTVGCVSGKGRSPLMDSPAENQRKGFEDYLQTDAFINPGNSGGPLVDVEGKVIGMNTMIHERDRQLAFAIPSNMLKEVSDQLIATGKTVRPYLGIQITTLGDNPTLREQFPGIDKGVIVQAIEADAPAYKSELRPIDVITAIDGVPVANARELQRQVLSKKPGQVVTLTLWRAGKILQLPVTTAAMPSAAGNTPAAEIRPEQKRPEAKSQTEALYGLELKDLDQANADRLGLKQPKGVLVGQVAEDSPAAAAGIKPDDVITEIESKPVADAAAARALIQSHEGKKPIVFYVERKGEKTFAVVRIEQ